MAAHATPEKINIEMENPLQEIANAVRSLYEFRDLYHENHAVEELDDKYNRVEQELGKVLLLFDRLENENSEIKNNADYLYLKGYALNVTDKYNYKAEEYLTDCRLLNNLHSDCWNALGECYFKSLDLEDAEVCIINGLCSRQNKTSLRNLSILARLRTTGNLKQNVEIALGLAREALGLDVTDGVSWLVLGNAYVSHYYRVNRNDRTIQLSLNAFKQAEKDGVARGISELYFNKGLMLTLQQEYSPSLASFDRSRQLFPKWEQPKIELHLLLRYLNEIMRALNLTLNMKPPKLKQFLRSIDDKYLHHYAEYKYRCLSGIFVKLKYVQFNDLNPGINEEKVILGKVVCISTTNPYLPPLTFCLVDKSGTCSIVTVCNMNKLRSDFRRGDFVAIPEPNVVDYDFDYQSFDFRFRLITLKSHMTIILNRRRAIPITKDVWSMTSKFAKLRVAK